MADAELPPVSVLVAAYNEESEIGDRIVNALKQDYPPGMLEVVIATDGCSTGPRDRPPFTGQASGCSTTQSAAARRPS